MNLKELIVGYIRRKLDSSKYHLQEYESGCAMIDVYLNNQKEILVIQAEPQRIGVSIISNEPLMDFSLPDQSFSDIEDCIHYLEKRIK